MAKEKKRPWLAAVLNFVIWGLGYLYLGKRKNFGILLVIGEILGFTAGAGVPPTPEISLLTLLALPSMLIISLAFAYDAYQTV